MNTFLLLQAIRNRLMPELENLPLLTRTRDRRDRQSPKTRPVAVSIGRRPPTQPGEDYDVPLIVVQAVSGSGTEDGFERVEVALRLVVWNDEPEGAENDLHNLISLVRRVLMRHRQDALDGRYVLAAGNREGELAPWARPDEQAPSFAEAYVMTHWTMQGNE